MKKTSESKLASCSGGMSCHDLLHLLTWMMYDSEDVVLAKQALEIHKLLGMGYTLCTT